MKRFSLGFGAALLAGIVCADAYRTFTDVQGRAISAKIVAFDAAMGKIEVEREDGNSVWVSPTIFSEADQAYIKKWIAADLLLSKNTLRISFKKRSKSVDTKAKSGADGFNGDAVHFEVTVNNRSKQPIENLQIDYRYFITVDDKERGERQRMVPGSTVIERIEPASSITFTTVPATFGERIRSVAVRDANLYPGNEELTVSDEELEGIWLKVYGPVVDEERAVRDVYYPASLEGRVAWGEDITPYMEKVMKRRFPINFEELQVWVVRDLQELEQTADEAHMREISKGIELYYEEDAFHSCATVIGMGFYRKGLYDLAALWMEKKQVITVGHPYAEYLILAELYASAPEICDGKKARNYVNQALERSTRPDAWILSVQARVYARNGQFKNAVNCQEQALATLSDWEKAHYEAYFTRCLRLYEAGIPYDLNADDPCCWQYIVRLQQQQPNEGKPVYLWPDNSSKENRYLCRMGTSIQGE